MSKTRHEVTEKEKVKRFTNELFFHVLPIIEDTQNNAKGFTSRILWYFPEPFFWTMSKPGHEVTEKEKVEGFTMN